MFKENLIGLAEVVLAVMGYCPMFRTASGTILIPAAILAFVR